MIKNDEQYERTKNWIIRYKQAIEDHEKMKIPDDFHPDIWRAVKDGYIHQRNELMKEVEEYEEGCK